jgi:FtsP/CotA-like multicopper oxidase with cupredoxin domain
VPTFQPDQLAPAPRTTYIFGFRDVTGMSAADLLAQKGNAQASAPLLHVDQDVDLTIQLTNLGLSQRPDLVDSHTVHFHGFRDAIPLFDGVPEMSISVPISRDFTYFYRPRDAGTYMYHCHFEDVEHVHMGMSGVVFVRPAQNKGVGASIPASRLAPDTPGLYAPNPSGPMGYVYNDGVAPGQPGSTAYDREFIIFLTDLWCEAHYDDAHIQPIDWTKYKPDYWLMNGRVYPDTLAPNSDPGTTTTGDRLQYQPISSLIQANTGERVLIRFVSLAYQQFAMTLDGPTMRVVGKDATLLRGTDGTDNGYDTNVVEIGPGESVDVIFTAPTVAQKTSFLLYNRDYMQTSNNDGSSMGGQVTQVDVYPSGLPQQTMPQTTY